jgi:hypothetical protein
MSGVPLIPITRKRQWARPGQTGPEWKWIYYLPTIQREETTNSGEARTVTLHPGGFSTKAETLGLVRRLYSERPLMVQWPDGKTTEVKR